MSLPSQKPLTAEEQENLKALFDAVDTDNDGKINDADLKNAMGRQGWEVNDDEAKALIARVDKDGSGFVTWDEFLALCKTRPIRRRLEARLRELFQAMDTDGSGFLTKSDLKALMVDAGCAEEFTDEEIDALITRVDVSGDGKISFEEFVGAFVRLISGE